MNSPQALSTVYAVAAQKLAVTEPLESLVFERSVLFARANLVIATANVTGLDVASVLVEDDDDETVFQACGLVLAKAVEHIAQSPDEVLEIFQQKFLSLVSSYCELSKSSVDRFHNIVSVEEAIKTEIENMGNYPYSRKARRYE
jgi:hypothetical protein